MEMRHLQKEVKRMKEAREYTSELDVILGEVAKKASCGYANAAIRFQHTGHRPLRQQVGHGPDNQLPRAPER